MTRNFSGKVVLVTGSSSGIGEGTAILFAKLGAHVVVTGRNEDNVKRVADICLSVSPKGLKPLEVIADITVDKEAKYLIESTVKVFGQIDVLVNNAGIVNMANITDENFMDTYDWLMRIDLRSVVYLSHLAVPHLEKTKGNIVNISSIGALKLIKNIATYCMAKSALDMFTKCLAVELGPKGIRVNGINCCAIKTNIFNGYGLADKVAELAKKISPLKTSGKPADIANGVTFLASEESAFITGSNMVVDGGLVFSFNIDF